MAKYQLPFGHKLQQHKNILFLITPITFLAIIYHETNAHLPFHQEY